MQLGQRQVHDGDGHGLSQNSEMNLDTSVFVEALDHVFAINHSGDIDDAS